MLVAFIRSGKYPDDLTKDQKRAFRRKAEHFVMRGDDICYRNNGTVLKAIFEYETDLIDHIIKTEHSLAHVGITKMVNLLNQKYYGIPKSAIADYVRNCEACSRFNSLRTIEPVYINDITRKYDRYIIDFIDLKFYAQENDGFSWILNVIDTYTKYLWSFKTKRKDALSVKASLLYIFKNYGVPVSIQADNGKEFKNNILRELLTSLNILIVHGRPRNPKAQGQVERVNQTAKRWLAKKLFQSNGHRWIDALDDVTYAYNITVHRATAKSPFLLFHGQTGFNNPLAGGEVIDTDMGLQPIVNVDDHIDDESVSYEAWNLSYDPNQITSDSELEVVLSVNNPESVDNDKIALNAEVQEHFQNYKLKTIQNKDSNLVVRTVEIGDQVLIKKDFDMNPATKRKPFESFYEDTVFTVTNLLNNNMIELKNNNTNEIKSVYKGTIKKL